MEYTAKTEKAFEESNRKVTIRLIKTTSILALTLILCGSVLDLFGYPEHQGTFFMLRILCGVCCVATYFAIDLPFFQRFYRLFTLIIPLIPAAFISLMIYISGDPASPYYAGLCICLVGLGFMFGWSTRESLLAVVIVLLMYATASVPALLQESNDRIIGTFKNNCIFILINGALIAMGCSTHFQMRRNEFLSSFQLNEKHEELGESNTQLQEALDQLKETEGQLVQSEKMASLGQMSAGVIHEINNPLNFTNSAIFILKKKGRKLPENERESFLELVSDIQEGLDRVSTIVSDLREFSHPDTGQLSNVDICHVVEMARRFMSKELRDAGVSLVVDMPDTAMIKGDQNKLVQVLVNLITNAVHALRDAGTVSPTVTVNFANNDDKDYVLTVRDNGKGIAEEHRNKLFDPFFTTKKVGEGTGLGLSICYRIIQEHQGTIDVESTVGEYTQFNMAFPKAA